MSDPDFEAMAQNALFEDWWERTGKTLDPDTSDVSWFDKRKGLAQVAFNTAMAMSRNYNADDSVYPTEITFLNGRFVAVRLTDTGAAYITLFAARNQ